MHKIYIMKTIQASIFIYDFKIVKQSVTIGCQLLSKYDTVFISKLYPTTNVQGNVCYTSKTLDLKRNVNENKTTSYLVLIFSKSELQSVNFKYIIIRTSFGILYFFQLVILQLCRVIWLDPEE